MFRSQEPNSSAATDQVHDKSLSTDCEHVADGDDHEPFADRNELEPVADDIDTPWPISELSDENDGSDIEESEFCSTQAFPESFLPNDLSKPLYEGANISICATYCAIMEFSSSARLPYSSTEKLLALLQLLCPPDSKLPSSIYKLKQFFRSFSTEYKKMEICSGCGQEFPADHTCP